MRDFVRYDTSTAFEETAGWSRRAAAAPAETGDGGARWSFGAACFTDRYVYYLPLGLGVPVVRYDTREDGGLPPRQLPLRPMN